MELRGKRHNTKRNDILDSQGAKAKLTRTLEVDPNDVGPNWWGYRKEDRKVGVIMGGSSFG